MIKLLSFPRRLVAQIIKPFRDQEPASVLIRETAKKEWKLILLNFLAAIVQAAAEGLTLGVMFLAVEVLQKSGGGLTIGDNQYLRAFPQIGQAFSQLSVNQAFALLLGLAVILKLLQGGAMALGQISIGYFGNRVSSQFTSRLHSHILNYTYACASRYRIGDLQYVTSSAPAAIINDIRSYSSLIAGLFLLLTYLAVLIRLSPWLLVAAVLMGGLSMLVQHILLPKIGQRASCRLRARASSRRR